MKTISVLMTGLLLVSCETEKDRVEAQVAAEMEETSARLEAFYREKEAKRIDDMVDRMESEREQMRQITSSGWFRNLTPEEQEEQMKKFSRE